MKAILESCFEWTNIVAGKCELDLYKDLACLYEIITSYSLVLGDIAFHCKSMLLGDLKSNRFTALPMFTMFTCQTGAAKMIQWVKIGENIYRTCHVSMVFDQIFTTISFPIYSPIAQYVMFGKLGLGQLLQTVKG